MEVIDHILKECDLVSSGIRIHLYKPQVHMQKYYERGIELLSLILTIGFGNYKSVGKILLNLRLLGSLSIIF